MNVYHQNYSTFASNTRNTSFVSDEQKMQNIPVNMDIDETNGMHDKIPAKSNVSLRVIPFAIIVFYNVCGGPFGMETTVRAGGPLFAILGFFLFTFIWSVPEALITAELGSTYPDSSGGVAWVERAFGKKTSFIMGYFSWVSGATDNAIYPVLFLVYLKKLIHPNGTSENGDMPTDENEFLRAVFLILTSTILTGINYLGLEIVGNLSILIAFLSLSPFVIMCAVGVFQVKPQRWLELSSSDAYEFQFDDDNSNIGFNEDGLTTNTFGSIHLPNYFHVIWRPFLNNLFWNLNSFDAGAQFSKDVKDLKTVYANGMKLSILFVALTYMIPLLVATGAVESKQKDWVDGYLVTLGIEIVGPWVGTVMVVAIGISNISLFIAELSADSYQIMGMAERGLIPKIFAARSRFGTPKYGILTCYLVILFMSFSDFNELIEVMNVFYSLSLMMEYAAFIKLRMMNEDRPQPYRIPLNTFGCILMITPACLTMTLLLATSSDKTLVSFVGFLFLGFIGYFFQNYAKERNWCAYIEPDDDDNDIEEDSTTDENDNLIETGE